MDIALIAIIVAAIAVVSVVAVSVIVRDRPGAKDREFDQPLSSSAVDGLHDTIDGSIGMFIIRRIRGKLKTGPAEDVAMTAAMSADELAYRIGVEGAPVPLEPEIPDVIGVAPTAPTETAASSATLAAGARAAAYGHAQSRGGISAGPTVLPIGVVTTTVPAAAVAIPRSPAAPRRRRIREAGVAVIGLAAVAVGAFLFWPSSPRGTDAAIAVVTVTASPTPTPVATPTAAPTATARITPTPVPTPVATAEPTPIPTPAPTAAPTASPTPTPKPTPKPPPARSVPT